MNRREFLQASALATLAAPLPSYASRSLANPGSNSDLEIPDLTDKNIIGSTVGLRPYRNRSVRIERTELAGKTLVHNYGHGGAGFTLAWGSAELSAELIRARFDPGEEVAVLGAGVIGLTTAWVLQEQGYKVTVYSKDFSPHTASDRGGAQWSPSAVAQGESDAEKRMLADALVRSYRRYERMQGSQYGISKRANYVADGFGGPLERVPPGLIAPPAILERLPFARTSHRGKLYFTFLIEPPIFLPALMNDLRAMGAPLLQRAFASSDEILSLPQSMIVNCTGLSSGQLFDDPLVLPIRGQLVLLRPAELPYLLIHEGYIFPRKDAIIVGGTFERGLTDTTPDPVTTQKILDISRKFFAPA